MVGAFKVCFVLLLLLLFLFLLLYLIRRNGFVAVSRPIVVGIVGVFFLRSWEISSFLECITMCRMIIIHEFMSQTTEEQRLISHSQTNKHISTTNRYYLPHKDLFCRSPFSESTANANLAFDCVYSWPQYTRVSLGRAEILFNDSCICAAVPSKRRPHPNEKSVSPVNTAADLGR